MKIEDVKVGMRVRRVRPEVGDPDWMTSFFVATVTRIFGPYFSFDSPHGPYVADPYLWEPEVPPTLRNTHMTAKVTVDDTSHRQMLAFFATPLTPNTCRKCAAPTPCKYHE